MKLYFWLRGRVPVPLAIAGGAAWLAALVFLAIVFADQPAGPFRYANL